nr:D-glycero-beta-D-manno-heptose 1-phosphate adenylyltransferase [Saprospiraceae bacterium]
MGNRKNKLLVRWKEKFHLSTEEALEVVDHWRSKGESIVFTNGCFDLLHIGHIQYLLEAKSLGDRLVLGINTDESVRKLKGKGRPVNPLDDRMKMIAALWMVDLVIPFEEDTPKELIQKIKPDTLVKGGDYPIDQIVGAEEVLKSGGKVFSLGFSEGYSSSIMIERIIKIKNNE